MSLSPLLRIKLGHTTRGLRPPGARVNIHRDVLREVDLVPRPTLVDTHDSEVVPLFPIHECSLIGTRVWQDHFGATFVGQEVE
jgi:hypothetical protein